MGGMAIDKQRTHPKLIYLVTEDWYFCSHRLPIARAARRAGYDVVVATRVTHHGDMIRDEGFRLHPLRWKRRVRNPLFELRAIRDIYSFYASEKPDIVHHVAIKPAVYGSIAARLAGVHGVVNAIAGLGYAFTSRNRRAAVTGRMLRTAFRVLLGTKGSRIIVQNPDDGRALAAARVTDSNRIDVILGSGVDLDRFAPSDEVPGRIRVAMVSRMVSFKGVHDFVSAARLLSQRNADLEMVLVGTPDDENPESVPESQLSAWHNEGVVSWAGRVEDVAALWRDSHIAVLPSHGGEGVPKSLLEAAASARPMVATDVPGCREVVVPDSTGILISPRDPVALADAIERLARDAALRRRFGGAARRRAVDRFGEGAVEAKTLAVYDTILSGARGENVKPPESSR